MLDRSDYAASDQPHLAVKPRLNSSRPHVEKTLDNKVVLEYSHGAFSEVSLEHVCYELTFITKTKGSV